MKILGEKGESPMRIRLLTATDLHQRRLLYEQLAKAVARHRPDAVALAGDALDACESLDQSQFSTAECARRLAALPTAHILFARGNHEDSNWTEFVTAWPHESRELVALYGAATAVGPLSITGFPCLTGSEFTWCSHLRAADNVMEMFPRKSRQPLPSDVAKWLPGLMRRAGRLGRTCWLMHECPVGLPLANPRVFNPLWTEAVERFSPRLVVSGHDHDTPMENNTWHTTLGKTVCVNIGQSNTHLHYAILDFEFPGSAPSLPSQITVAAYPWNENIVIKTP